MNAFKMNKNTKTGKSAAPVHQSTINGSSHIKGISPTSAGPLSTFYSMDPVLSLKGIVQPKLTIGQPNDRYEQEADRVADQVMRMPEPGGSLVNSQWSLGKREKESSLVQRQSACPECPEKEEIMTKPVASQITPLVQRQAEEEEEEEVQAKLGDGSQVQRQEEEEEEGEPIQAKHSSDQRSRDGVISKTQIHSKNCAGTPLPHTARTFFEPRFDRDFSKVRVHTCSSAVQMSMELNARAFTYGRNIFFGAGKYNPGTSSGKRLLAHELTHVVQQNPAIGSGNDSTRPWRLNKTGDADRSKVLRKSITPVPGNCVQCKSGTPPAGSGGSVNCKVKKFKMRIDPWDITWPDGSGNYGIQLPVNFDLVLDSGTSRADCLIGQLKTGQRERWVMRTVIGATGVPLSPIRQVDVFPPGTYDAPPGQKYWWDGSTVHAGNVNWRWTYFGCRSEGATFEDAPGWTIVGSFGMWAARQMGRKPQNVTRASFPIYLGGIGRKGYFKFTTFIKDKATKSTIREIKWGLLIDYTTPKKGKKYFYL